jgi:DNA-binding response OmpR family regulator
MMEDRASYQERARAESPAMPQRLESAAPLTVMVVEDSADVRMMMKILLEMEGYLVIEAADGLSAVELAVTKRPALIMMDLNLPLMDGLAATGRIREQLPEVPIVVLSGHTSEDYRSAAFKVGCTDYLIKPLDFKLLEVILRSLPH